MDITKYWRINVFRFF